MKRNRCLGNFRWIGRGCDVIGRGHERLENREVDASAASGNRAERRNAKRSEAKRCGIRILGVVMTS